MSKKLTEYAAYKGDTFLGIGTVYELSDLLGYTVKTLRSSACDFAHNKCGDDCLIVFKLDYDEE